MAAANATICVKTHRELPRATEDDLKSNGAHVLDNADRGIQTAIVNSDGALRSIIGLNGIRYLPDPDPDPLDEIIGMALDAAARERE